MSLRISIDRETCHPCGVCESIFPECFKLEGIMTADAGAGAKDLGRLRYCQEACPYDCIKLEI